MYYAYHTPCHIVVYECHLQHNLGFCIGCAANDIINTHILSHYKNHSTNHSSHYSLPFISIYTAHSLSTKQPTLNSNTCFQLLTNN